MFTPGELIIYSGEGVCRVECVGQLSMPGVGTDKQYYTLQPIYHTGKIFVPIDTKVYMRPVLTRKQAQEFVRRIPEIETEIFHNRNLRALTEHYQALLQTHNCESMLQLIKAAYAKRQEAQAQGKKPGLVEDRFMKRAEDMLYGELAVALDIPKDSVCSYIADVLEPSEIK